MLSFDLEPLHWFLLGLFCVLVEGFYSMIEMAILSVNRLDLIYDCACGSRRAKWVSKLLRDPDSLFTTALLVVNLVLQMGSECSRRFYQSLDLSSGIAPLTQVVLVIVLAELAPMFVARQHPRTVALFGIPVFYATSVILKPCITVVTWLSNGLNALLGAPKEEFNIVSREDLKSVVLRMQPHQESGPESFLEKVGSNIFSMQEVCAKDVAKPLTNCPTISSQASTEELRDLFDKQRTDFALVLDPNTHRALGIVLPRFLLDPTLRQPAQVFQLVKPTLIVQASAILMKLMAPLRQSRYSIAIVVDPTGMPIGCLTFDEISHYLFDAHPGHVVPTSGMLLDRTFDLKTTLGWLRHSWTLEFGQPDDWTLDRFLHHVFERPAESGEKYLHRGIELELVEGGNSPMQVRIRTFVHR